MEMLDSLVSWPTLGIVLFAYGFAPGALLRLIVLAFPRDDPRRDELLAELYVVPRLERPVWVFEQMEVALFEGMLGRLQWAATGRVIHRWHLGSGVERNRLYPDTFEIPSEEEKASLKPGMGAKLMFEMRDGWGERMWVDVTEVRKRYIVGRLANQPVGIPRLSCGDTVKFKYQHVISIVPEGWWDELPPIDSACLKCPLYLGGDEAA
jgi:hypothetical protein